MGCVKSVQREDKLLGIAKTNSVGEQKSLTWVEEMLKLEVFQIVDRKTGLVIVPQGDIGMPGSVLIYSGKVAKSDIRSFFYFQDGAYLRHVDSGLCVKGESGGHVKIGLALALQSGAPDQDATLVFDGDGYLRHPATGALMQPGGNTCHEGARLLAMDDFLDADNALIDIRFSTLPVPGSVLEFEFQRKLVRDDQRAFENSSDGKMYRMRQMGIPLDDINAHIVQTVAMSDPLRSVEVGMTNKVRIATNSNPVLNLSVQNTLSLNALADDTEVWSLMQAANTPGLEHATLGQGEVFGGGLIIRNQSNGFTLAMNEQGQLCHSETTHNVWQVLDAGDSRVFLLNLDLRCALSNHGGLIQVLTADSAKVEQMLWSITQY